MWTPKRVVLLALGLAAFVAAYLGYNWRLGGIDGLPPLPETYWPDKNRPDLPPQRPRESAVDKLLTQAFGPECQELNRPYRIEFRLRNMVLAAGSFEPVDDNHRIRLSPVSLALFGKNKGDGRGVEINTIRGKVAYLTFDRPIGNYLEMGSRRIVAAELAGDILIVNNRRNPQRFDDLSLQIATGPLFYEEKTNRIWTDDEVLLQDNQSKPEPIVVRGKGMVLDLLAEAPPPRPGAPAPRKPRSETITGVKRIVLQKDVDMHLYVEARSGFLNGPRGAEAQGKEKPKDKPPNQAPPEKAHLHLKTDGPFQYDFFKDFDLARFDVPVEDPAHPFRSPKAVEVMRHHRSLGKWDQLLCQRLELRLRRKEAAPGKGPAGPKDDTTLEQGIDIEWAHATGKLVTLASDTEELHAEGDDFLFDAHQKRTILKGASGVEVTKEGKDCSKIWARELHIQEQTPAGKSGSAKPFHQVTALGPGRINLLDKELHDKKIDKILLHATWNDKLVSTRDGPNDLLILTGSAALVDDEHEQNLQGETVKVWLDHAEPDGPAVPGQTAAQQARRPNHLEAVGNVLAVSREMNVHNTGRLVVWFRDVAAEALPVARPGFGAPPGPAAPPPAHVADKPVAVGPAVPAPAPAPAPPAKAEPEPARPIDLEARSVEAWVLRAEVRTPEGKTETRNALDRLRTEGSVHVRQDPAKPGEKGVEITGDTLQMHCRTEGNFLVVTGDLARLQMDKMTIMGQEVNIDQAENKAWVYDAGAMIMESETNFQGEKLTKPVPLTIQWTRLMSFNGKWAEFYGGTQAYQDNAQLLCNSLQVTFDQAISLKEGSRGDKPARVKKLVCDKSVHVEDKVLEGDRLVRYQGLRSVQMDMTVQEKEEGAPPGREGNIVYAKGPGEFRLLQLGGGPEAIGPPSPSASPKKPVPAGTKPAPAETEPEMKLTCVRFLKNMRADSKKNEAIFLENVRVLNLPGEDPHAELDFDAPDLPKGALYLTCDRLEVRSRRPDPKGKAYQDMTAKGRVVVKSDNFSGRADLVTYDEEKDQIIFQGVDGGIATLYKARERGGPMQEFKGRKITYLRRTGKFQTDDGRWLDGESN